MDIQHIKDWVSRVLDGTEKPYVKSAEAVNDGGPLRKLVGSEHDKIVMDEDTDVFVDYYAPWCSHCVRFEPTWKQIASYYAYDTQLIIANIDMQANDVEGDYIKKFPTLIFYPAGKNKKDNKIFYSGSRDFNSIKTWIDQHSTKIGKREGIKVDL